MPPGMQAKLRSDPQRAAQHPLQPDAEQHGSGGLVSSMNLGDLPFYDAFFSTLTAPPSAIPPTTSPMDHAAPALDVDALLENPLTAALVAAQLKGRRPAKDPSHPLPPNPTATHAPPAAHAISKPRPKKKIRPKERLDILQKHLDGLVDQVKHLSLRNRQLSKKKEVLEHLVKEIDRCEQLALQFQRDIEHHKAHPEQPPRGAAAMKDWTPQQFIAFYKGELGRSSKWILEVEAAGGVVSPEAGAELEAMGQRILDTVFFTCHMRHAFIPKVKTEMFKQFPGTMPEEKHWAEVVLALELTEGQVEDLLVAREVFFSIMDRMEREQEVVQASIHQQIELASTPDSYMRVLCMEEDVVTRIMANLQKRAGFMAVLAMFIFLRTLTPLQVAKCALHSLPLFPDPIIIMNCIYAKHWQAPGVQALLTAQPPPGAPTHTPATIAALPAQVPMHPSPTLALAPATTRGSGSLPATSSSSLSLSSSTSDSLGPAAAAPSASSSSTTPAVEVDRPGYLRLLESPHFAPLQLCCPNGWP